ncbi:hypothetical protein QJS10_CPA03g02411 [Acorus calamus]|uniref:N-acetylglucosaminylphosphatidylinositol deacetylase n=1 Tax=Acorus calamus TaxID=4465 RepID=A0AAV9F8S9_ACOCL|nr:hypothetical protein QJS10_CPA03g02411 [Acorus calamus]
MGWLLMAMGIASMAWAISLFRLFCSPSTPTSFSKEMKNILLVIAHPDDESMFFSPTILSLGKEGHNLQILCMSTGNADGKGDLRKEELYRACGILKISPDQVKIIDHPSFQDGFHHAWDHHLLARIVEEHIKLWDIELLITFDSHGVSGHPNHRDVHHGIHMVLSGNSQRKIEAWELISTTILRKYSGPLDIWLSILQSKCYQGRHTHCFPNSYPRKTYLAMAQHDSQWIWFRKLFVAFSGYTYVNIIRRINV